LTEIIMYLWIFFRQHSPRR